jgi:hypothetical protein
LAGSESDKKKRRARESSTETREKDEGLRTGREEDREKAREGGSREGRDWRTAGDLKPKRS